MYYKLQCWLAIFRQLPHTAQHPCASLSIPVPLGGSTGDTQGRMHQVAQAKGSISLL